MNKLLVSIAAAVILCVCLTTAAFAAPYYVSTSDYGNTAGLITITRPDKDKDFSYDRGYYMTGAGRNGVSVTLYKYDANANAYAKLYKNGYEQTMWIGASGLFWNTIYLTYGDNYLLARAENGDGTYQTCRFLLTYQSSSLKGITFDFTGAW